ncbi:hypothetical protein ANO14919_043700 [Xylariales sp. No.14919]|nr:hypothetical protein ANO14919_043700 [Xylariales sp. No.14919]
MKSSVVLAAISAGLVVGELPPPSNFPACGTTCLNNMLGQASELGCGGGGSTADTVDGACLCNNINFSYGIIDCANALCPGGVAPSVIQYGVDWCAEKGVIISGLSATPDSSIASSPTATVSAVGTASEGSTGSGTASATSATNSEGSSATNSGDTTTATNGPGESSGTGVVIPISTTEIVSTVTNSDGSVETTAVSTSTIFSTSGAASGSGTESGSATDSGSASESTPSVTESTITTSGSTLVTSATITEPASSTETAGAATSTSSDGGALQTAAPVGFVAAAGLAVLML